MADSPNQNQNPQVKTIDDLVNEISKPIQPNPAHVPINLSNRPAANYTPSPTPQPTPPSSPNLVSPQPSTIGLSQNKTSSPIPQSTNPNLSPLPNKPLSQTPQSPAQPQIREDVTSIQSPKTAQTAQSSEYQSSIRTMKDDLGKIKSGQTSAPLLQTRTALVNPVSNKPGQPSPASLETTSKTGENTIKTPSPPIKSPAFPSVVSQKQTPTPPLPGHPSLTPDSGLPNIIQNKATLRSPTDVSRDLPIIKPSMFGRLSLALGLGGLNSRYAIYGLIGLIIIGVGYGVFYFIQSFEADIPIATFTPRPSQTPVASAVNLDTVFSGLSKFSVSPGSSTDIVSAFHQQSRSEIVASGQFRIAQFTLPSDSASLHQPPFISLLKTLSVSHPPELSNALGQDYLVLIYGQRELFNEKGERIPNLNQDKRYVFLVEVINQDILTSTLSTWNSSIAVDLSKLLQISNPPQGPFSQNQYRGLVVNYRNFPWPDRSLDLVVVPVGTTKNYLVIANSREAALAVIERLRDFKE